MKAVMSTEYKTSFKGVKERIYIYKAQYDALKAVNKELINLYRGEAPTLTPPPLSGRLMKWSINSTA
ncbi:MAG: hypothetical protein IT393_02115 [Nitrospirae bacterium]|nr:hypothetical protein [Nitrospirota bacterium]